MQNDTVVNMNKMCTFKGVSATVTKNEDIIKASKNRITSISKGYIPDNDIYDIIHTFDGSIRPVIVHLVDSDIFDEMPDMGKNSYSGKVFSNDNYRAKAIRNHFKYGDRHHKSHDTTEVHIIFDIPKLVKERKITTPLSIGLDPFKLEIAGKRVICDGIKLQR